MKLRKLAGVVTAVFMTAAMSLTAFAAPSPSVDGTVSAEEGEVQVAMTDVPAEYAEAVAQLDSRDTLRNLLGAQYKDTMQVVAVREVSVPEGTPMPVTIEFQVTGVRPTTDVAILHYDTVQAAWENIPATAGEGTITATFQSLSPVAFVVDTATSSAATTTEASTTKSPKTGESSMVVVFGAVAAIAACGVYGLSRKRA